MAIYTNLPVYKASYALLLSVSKAMPGLPRDCRYSIGQDLRRKITEIIIHWCPVNSLKALSLLILTGHKPHSFQTRTAGYIKSILQSSFDCMAAMRAAR